MISQWGHFFNYRNPVVRGFNVFEAAPCASLLAARSLFVDANKKFAAGGVGKCRYSLGKVGWVRFNSLQINIVTFFNLKNAISFGAAYLMLVNFLGHDATSNSIQPGDYIGYNSKTRTGRAQPEPLGTKTRAPLHSRLLSGKIAEMFCDGFISI
jgi:hypothetical protein